MDTTKIPEVERRKQVDAAAAMHSLLRDHRELPMMDRWTVQCDRRGTHPYHEVHGDLPAASAESLRNAITAWCRFLAAPRMSDGTGAVGVRGTYHGVTVLITGFPPEEVDTDG